jgi:hypothetical protein
MIISKNELGLKPLGPPNKGLDPIPFSSKIFSNVLSSRRLDYLGIIGCLWLAFQLGFLRPRHLGTYRSSLTGTIQFDVLKQRQSR